MAELKRHMDVLERVSDIGYRPERSCTKSQK